jgi:putative ABC transport system permease protein
MRTQDLIATAVANTFRSKLRTTLTVVAIFIGAFTLTLTTAVGTGVSVYVRTQVASIGATDSMTVTKNAATSTSTGSGPKRYSADAGTTTSGTGRPGSSTESLTASDVTTISGIDGVTGVTRNQAVSTSWIEYGTAGRWVLTTGATAAADADLASGAQLDRSTDAAQILLPTTYVHNVGLGSAKAAVGRTVTIGIKDYAGVMHTVDATVVGIQNATLFTSGASVNTALRSKLVALQRTGTPSTVATTYGSVTATYADGSTGARITAIKTRLKDAGYTGQTVDDQLGSILTVINGIVGVLDAFAVIALLAAGFGIVNTLLMSVQERTREIGLMKAMGMSGRRVFALFSFEAVFIGFLGSAIGAGIAIGFGSVLSDALSRGLLADLPGLQILQFSVGPVLLIVLVVMAISFLAGTLPARRAARQNPIDALRYE